MITNDQLRIGNYVIADNVIRQISTISDSYASTTTVEDGPAEKNKQHSLRSLEPIVLNDDILKRCHFVFHDYFKFWQLLNGSGENRSEMDIDKDYNVIDYSRRPVVKKVTSLHQLQNVYFILKGKELEFEQN